MPEPFLNCVSKKGKVVTKSLSGNRYVHICYLNGKSYPSEVKTKVAKQKKG